jgi:hypothetical protein
VDDARSGTFVANHKELSTDAGSRNMGVLVRPTTAVARCRRHGLLGGPAAFLQIASVVLIVDGVVGLNVIG